MLADVDGDLAVLIMTAIGVGFTACATAIGKLYRDGRDLQIQNRADLRETINVMHEVTQAMADFQKTASALVDEVKRAHGGDQ